MSDKYRKAGALSPRALASTAHQGKYQAEDHTSIPARWSEEDAGDWYARQPWLIGCNFIPSAAVNQLEMWQAETFDSVSIDWELGLAADIGFNTVRTFLHDLAWVADADGLKQRIDCFLDIARRHGIRPIMVIFDDCWNPDPRIGCQPEPKPGIHNSGWVQSPGLPAVNAGPAAWGRLEQYVKDILRSFAADERVLMWDLYNEPGNSGNGANSLPLLKRVFEWARDIDPSQPLTAGVWFNNTQLNEFQLGASDILTFHNYSPADELERQIIELKSQDRPLICTEWMARTCGSLVSTHLPVFQRARVGCVNWGLVAGKTNTIHQWQVLPDFVKMSASYVPLNPAEEVWFHDLLRTDGSPYDRREIDLFRQYIGR